MKKLSFTKLAKEKYEGLTGSQQTFVDQGLDQLKQGKSLTNRLENKDLNLTIICENSDKEDLITDIKYSPYRQSDNYEAAQKRMNDWNN